MNLANRFRNDKRTFSLDCPHGHETRDGRSVRIVSTDRVGYGQPIVALIQGPSGEMIAGYRLDGRYAFEDGTHKWEHDLVDRKAPAS